MSRSRPTLAARLAVGVACLFLAACASNSAEQLIDSGPTPHVADPDPLEPMNRGVFWFNDGADKLILQPLAIGWTWITPEYLRTHLKQVIVNLNFPGQLVNNLLQGDVRQAGVDIGRFVMNTTVGVAGFFDPASHHFDWQTRHEDFGQTLGVWGLGPGAYLMLPLLGPSDSRDLAALPVDAVLNVGSSPLWGVVWGTPGTVASSVRQVNSRALALDQIREARRAALDWYSFVRDAYLQQRSAAIRNDKGLPASEPGEDLYELDEDEDE